MTEVGTTPAKGYAEIVDSRNALTLLSVIDRVVIRVGSVIHTDQWPSHAALGRSERFSHNTDFRFARTANTN